MLQMYVICCEKFLNEWLSGENILMYLIRWKKGQYYNPGSYSIYLGSTVKYCNIEIIIMRRSLCYGLVETYKYAKLCYAVTLYTISNVIAFRNIHRDEDYIHTNSWIVLLLYAASIFFFLFFKCCNVILKFLFCHCYFAKWRGWATREIFFVTMEKDYFV